jgi:putative endonuclease
MATPTKPFRNEGFFCFEMFIVYILYIYSLKKYYTGFTGDLEQGLEFHNSGTNHFSKKGIPWLVVKTFKLQDKKSAMQLEKQIKKNGAKRYLERNNIEYNI